MGDRDLASTPATGDVVALDVPAGTAYVGLVRTVAAGLASRLDLDLDHIEDVRLGVTEACAVVLPAAVAGALLRVRLVVSSTGLDIEVSAPADPSHAPSQDSFAWTVLRALADEAVVAVEDASLTVRLRFSTAHPVSIEEVAGADPS